MSSPRSVGVLTLLASWAVAVCAAQVPPNQPQEQRTVSQASSSEAHKVPVIDGAAGPCSLELSVTADNKPVYAAAACVLPLFSWALVAPFADALEFACTADFPAEAEAWFDAATPACDPAAVWATAVLTMRLPKTSGTRMILIAITSKEARVCTPAESQPFSLQM